MGCIFVAEVVGGFVIPGDDFRRGDWGGDVVGTCRVFVDGGDEGGCRAEDYGELVIDGRFDIDGVRGGGGIDEGDEYAAGEAKYGGSDFAELGGRVAGFVEGFLIL